MPTRQTVDKMTVMIVTVCFLLVLPGLQSTPSSPVPARTFQQFTLPFFQSGQFGSRPPWLAFFTFPFQPTPTGSVQTDPVDLVDFTDYENPEGTERERREMKQHEHCGYEEHNECESHYGHHEHHGGDSHYEHGGHYGGDSHYEQGGHYGHHGNYETSEESSESQSSWSTEEWQDQQEVPNATLITQEEKPPGQDNVNINRDNLVPEISEELSGLDGNLTPVPPPTATPGVDLFLVDEDGTVSQVYIEST